jgi:putative CocE/NonD family hydrolase
MSVTGRFLTWLLRLPPPETPDVEIRRDIPVTMPDGVVLLADHYVPRTGTKLPTILVRSPYGRRGPFGFLYATLFAERGFQVFIQSCRGTAGSGGKFTYVRHEHEDGLATLEWIKKQDWFSGDLAMMGASYLGFVQWSVAAFAGPELKALIPQVTSSDFNHFRYQSGTFTLETILGWSTMMAETASTGTTFKGALLQNIRQKKLEKAFLHLPLKEADTRVVGRPTEIFQEAIHYSPEDDYWKPVDYSQTVPDIEAPVYLQAGWYDLFLHWQLLDYKRLRSAGKQPYLIIGPWYHGEPKGFSTMTRESLRWLNAHLKGDKSRLRANPVRLYVMGANTWREFSDWPPPAQEERWYLQPGGGLGKTLPPATKPDRYAYDPANPPPAVGGNSLGKSMGRKDNSKLELREDVLVYTGGVLDKDMEIIGPVTADLYVRSSLAHTDFYAKLCVVEQSGKSYNLCEGITRITPGCVQPETDGSLHISVELWPTAYRYRSGERIRLQISSASHPRFNRNTGSAESLGEATTLKVAEQSVYHDPNHPSALILPVVEI